MATINCPSCGAEYSSLLEDCAVCQYIWDSDDHEELNTREIEEDADQYHDYSKE